MHVCMYGCIYGDARVQYRVVGGCVIVELI